MNKIQNNDISFDALTFKTLTGSKTPEEYSDFVGCQKISSKN